MVVGKEVRSDHDRPRKVRGGMSPWWSKAEARRCGLPSRATFQTIPWIRISIRKEQDKGKLQISKEKLLPPH